MNIDETKLAYLAGVFDGEGCIRIEATQQKDQGFKSLRYRLRLSITNTSKPLMDWLKSIGWVVQEDTWKGRRDYWKQCWKAFTHDRKALELLKVMLPYLLVKDEEARIAIEFQEHKDLIGNHNGRNGLSEDEINYRECLRKRLSDLKSSRL